jgi:uncharacterized protein
MQLIFDFIDELRTKGYNPSRVILFGSYAIGNPHEYSDIDLAIWDDRFTGCLPEDIENMIKAGVKKPILLEPHTFHSSETVETNPFIDEILKNGISLHDTAIP